MKAGPSGHEDRHVKGSSLCLTFLRTLRETERTDKECPDEIGHGAAASAT